MIKRALFFLGCLVLLTSDVLGAWPKTQSGGFRWGAGALSGAFPNLGWAGQGLQKPDRTHSWVMPRLAIVNWGISAGLLAQGEPRVRGFPRTGQTVKGDFLHFFEEHGGPSLFSYPITASFYSQEEQRQVQYFQKARLEVDPADGQVRLSPLPGKLILEKRTAPISRSEAPPGGAFFEPTGHSVVLEFLEFYWQHGGPEVFGYPISELTTEDERVVQFFERAVLEWRPRLAEGERVQLWRLGEAHFQIAGHDPSLLEPEIPATTVTDIKVSASVRSPVVSLQEAQQQVYVYVSDQLGNPLTGAQVHATVLMPISKRSEAAVLTDESGTAIFDLSVSSLPAGTTIPIQVRAAYQQHTSDTATAFRVWW